MCVCQKKSVVLGYSTLRCFCSSPVELEPHLSSWWGLRPHCSPPPLGAAWEWWLEREGEREREKEITNRYRIERQWDKGGQTDGQKQTDRHTHRKKYASKHTEQRVNSKARERVQYVATNICLWRLGQHEVQWRPVCGGEPWGPGGPSCAGRDSGTTQTAREHAPESVDTTQLASWTQQRICHYMYVYIDTCMRCIFLDFRFVCVCSGVELTSLLVTACMMVPKLLIVSTLTLLQHTMQTLLVHCIGTYIVVCMCETSILLTFQCLLPIGPTEVRHYSSPASPQPHEPSPAKKVLHHHDIIVNSQTTPTPRRVAV